jgi:hypothetical protein
MSYRCGRQRLLGRYEVDLVFPRNDTYAPAPYVPIVFGSHNIDLETNGKKFEKRGQWSSFLFIPGTAGASRVPTLLSMHFDFAYITVCIITVCCYRTLHIS